MQKAVVALIIKDGLILSISRRHDKTKFGLIGGKVDPGETLEEALIREVKEETGITIKDCVFIYERVELGDGPDGVDYYSRCYYATSWTGEPVNSEEGLVKWITAEEVTSKNSAFGDYNRKTIDIFKTMFPNVNLIGEFCSGGCNNTGWQSGDNEGFICDICDRSCVCENNKQDCCVHRNW